MEKEKNNIAKILAPKDYMYLGVFFLMIVICGLDDIKIIIPGIFLWLCMLFLSVFMNKMRKEKIEKHIEHSNFNVKNIENSSLSSFPLPMATIEMNGVIIWYNNLFQDIIGDEGLIERHIFEFIPDIKPDELINDNKFIPTTVNLNNKTYQVVGNITKLDTKSKKDHFVLTLYFIDNTDYTMLQKIYTDEKACIGVAVIDNYDELMQSIQDEGRPQLLAEIDRKLNAWYGFTSGVAKKYERDKYIMLFESKFLAEMEEGKFEVLDLVKEIDIGNKLPVTLSIGIASEYDNFAEGLKDALAAIELALGRGGDQVVINRHNEYSFFGGKSKEVEKRTRVKARVMANALEKLIEQSGNVIIMGHANPDADAIGSAVGLFRVAQCLNRDAYIVIDNLNNITIKEMMNRLETSGQYEGVFLRHNEALAKINNDTLLIVVDTHRASFTELPELLQFTKKVVVIDHHRKVADFIGEAILTYHEIYASSACELVTELLQYMDKKVTIRQIEEEALYAGIIVDTKNFTFKTGIRTFEAAAFLKKYGVDTISVKQMFQNDFDIYMAKADVIRGAEIIDNEIAISMCDSEKDGALIAAQSADDLLNITGIKASFVLSKADGKIAISGRSLGDINVQVVLEKLGGGGSITIAGAQLSDVTEEEALEKLKGAIAEYKAEN
ncbi:MAG: DHH family phosphoesterase [Clostridia bacterium]|nr:DHH family phosphoesterase [Clostridia bacterium]